MAATPQSPPSRKPVRGTAIDRARSAGSSPSSVSISTSPSSTRVEQVRTGRHGNLRELDPVSSAIVGSVSAEEQTYSRPDLDTRRCTSKKLERPARVS
jgi:hypothetical protein